MEQQLKFSILNNVIGSEKLDQFSGRLDKLAKGLTVASAATYLFSKAKDNFTQGIQKIADGIDFGDQLQALSEKTGIGAQALSGYQAAAEQANLSIGSLEVGLRKFSQQLADPNADKFKDSLRALGVSAVDPTTNKLRDSSVIIGQLADKFEKMEDGPKKAALSIALFGKAGTDLIPFLNMGSAELTKFGLSFSDSFTSNADKFNDNLSVISNVFKQKLINVLDQALPKLVAIQELLISTFSGNGKDNWATGDKIGSFFAGFFDWVNRIYLAVENLFDRLKVLGEVLGNLGGVAATVGQAFYAALTFETDKAIIAGLKNGFDVAKQMMNDTFAGFDARQKARQDSFNSFAARAKEISEGKNLSDSASKKKIGLEPTLPDDRTRQERDAIDKFVVAQKQQIELQKQRNESYKYSTYEIERNSLALQINSQVERESIGWSQKSRAELREKAKEMLEVRMQLLADAEAQKASFAIGAQEAFKEYLENIKNVALQSKNLFTTAFRGIEDALVSFVRKGKLDFTDFANAVLDQMARIAVQQATLGILTSIGLGSIGGAGGSAAAGGGGYLGVNTAFANGGVMTSMGPVELRKYAGGGIANRPQLAMFGEGSMPEAYVPLPNGRSIPVEMSGGSNGTINVIVNVSSGSDSVSSSGTANAESATLLAAKVKELLINEKRPGGLLA